MIYCLWMNDDNRSLIVKPPVQLALAAVVVGGLFYVLGQYVASQPQRIEKEAEANRDVTVQGHGEVTAKPDVARITLGVTTGTQPTAKVALDLLSRRFTDVVNAVKALGVKEEDVKTTNLSINPQYDFREGRQAIRGFEASESIQVTIRDLGKIGDVLAKTTLEGVNQASGITFEMDDPNTLQREAQEKAIKNARENAEQLAKALGVRLGRVKTFHATGSAPPYPPPFLAEARGLALDRLPEAPAPPVPPGTQDISATVTIIYELK